MSYALRLSFVASLSACGGTSADISMTGTNAFAATSTIMLTKGLHCHSGLLPSGNLDALTVVVADIDLGPTCPTNVFDFLPHVLQLEVATGGYFASDPSSANQPISPGMTFPILNEHVTDEELCGNVPAGTTQPTAVAMLHECPNGSPCSYAKQFFASAGSITVSSVSSTSATGTFDLTLVNMDGESGGALSGSFSALPCP